MFSLRNKNWIDQDLLRDALKHNKLNSFSFSLPFFGNRRIPFYFYKVLFKSCAFVILAKQFLRPFKFQLNRNGIQYLELFSCYLGLVSAKHETSGYTISLKRYWLYHLWYKSCNIIFNNNFSEWKPLFVRPKHLSYQNQNIISKLLV